MTGPEICDRPGCGAERGQSNGWWVVMRITNAWLIAPYQAAGCYGKKDQKVCGQDCAHRLLSEFLEKEGTAHVKQPAGDPAG